MDKTIALNDSDSVKTILKGLRDSFPDEVRDEEVQKKSFSPSALVWGDGVCARRWSLLFDGAHWKSSNDAISIDRMQAGTDGHERIQKRIEKGPLDADIEVNLRNEHPPINSYCDIVANVNGKRVPIEIKTVSDMAFEARKTSQKGAHYHLTQLLIYMRLLDSDEGLLMYENRDTFKKFMVPVYMNDFYREYLDDIFEWMRIVYDSHEDGYFPKVFKGRRKNSRICAGCPVREACDDAPVGDIEIPLLKGLDKR